MAQWVEHPVVVTAVGGCAVICWVLFFFFLTTSGLHFLVFPTIDPMYFLIPPINS